MGCLLKNTNTTIIQVVTSLVAGCWITTLELLLVVLAMYCIIVTIF